jgi:hypothetical protein
MGCVLAVAMSALSGRQAAFQIFGMERARLPHCFVAQVEPVGVEVRQVIVATAAVNPSGLTAAVAVRDSPGHDAE